MRQVTSHPLWIGHSGDLRNVRGILSLGISAVVDLADSEPLALLPRELIYCRFPISDGGGNPRWLLTTAIELIAHLQRNQVPTLVCCSAGMSRSVSIAAAALAFVELRPFAEVLAFITQSGPVDICPELLSELRDCRKE